MTDADTEDLRGIAKRYDRPIEKALVGTVTGREFDQLLRLPPLW